MTVQVYLGVSLFALLIVATHGFPAKGSNAQDQSSSDTNTGGSFGSHHRAATGHFSPMTFSVSRPVERSSLSQSVTDPAAESLSSIIPEVGYPVSGVPLVPIQAAYVGSVQTGAAQPGPPETKWTVDPKIFSEEGLANTQNFEFSDILHSPSGPVLQSGETSNVVKEAELGNYQHETEEFGYPGASMVPGQGLENVLLPRFGVGGIWGYPSSNPYHYANFDYRLLYGLYPPGTYSTFSKSNEKGKDHFQDIHYLKRHKSEASDNSASDQQKLFVGNR